MARKKMDNPLLTYGAESMVIYAFRYCLGRMSYAVGECVCFLMSNWRYLSSQTQGIIARELNVTFLKDDLSRKTDASHHPLGMDCDRDEWQRLRDFITKWDLEQEGYLRGSKDQI